MKKKKHCQNKKMMLTEYFCAHMLCLYKFRNTLFVDVIIAKFGCFFAVHRNDFSTWGQNSVLKIAVMLSIHFAEQKVKV